MIGPIDEYPVHQTPRPIATPATSDRNFYDRSYFNLFDHAGRFMIITGIGYYPRLGVKDAYVLVRHADTQTAVHLSDAIDAERLNPHVGTYRIEVIEPLQRVRVILEETEGIALDATWTGLFPAVGEEPHVMTTGSRVTLDACRFAQVGTWTGTAEFDGERVDITAGEWNGSRDRSWGIRPIGEPEPAGRPADPPFGGMWWLYLPVAFDDFWIMIIMQEQPDGSRTLYDCTRISRDGRVEQMTSVTPVVDYASGTRTALGGRVEVVLRSGATLRLDIEALQRAPLALGAGYGGDSDWSHGTWKGEKFVERVRYDMTDPAILGRIPFSLTDASARVVCTEADGSSSVGWGLFEHGVLGAHEPSGFTDWMSVAD